ncbi:MULTISPECIES: hypothetical protein [unclassified Roseateles]|jgi:hypothetical protein|uniref:hypothetical protein n=1 Tax=unclassified Roseateles TaxID=2626991 RepID=UPI0006FB5588|nr:MULTISPECIES: hypothetical protein [unclassified Roseateles]KQW44704.1 hypothetical protein ASC81_14040 [Pelomonas sp. Root405]KRA70063.1 hypothetical protein ASD88_18200 [Pelomonas sp. Root662]
MKPQQRLLQVTSGIVITLAVLTACRKEVPPPNPIPAPDRLPKPTTLQPATQFAAVPFVGFASG